ncbi:E3 ubiquitin ligase big brother-related [Thalictrum thalictroides]|uniref:E3 ubiquitin ligase big brother-related n=1 Tax=Thalictrum thalictroides TaxID=46969 RepID=A0A7J6VY42_THATH|nr:E3 ubiquitin ligase big brother-related [Thalictrum thalictroides]
MENEEDKQSSKVTFSQLDQLETDMALAVALQQQEREFINLMMSENDSEDDSNGSASGEEDSFALLNDHTAYVNLEELEEENDSDYQDMEEDDVDPDELSYEDLIALGEIVGTENRGLPDNEITHYLHSYSYKCQPNCKDFDQCVICQFEYEEDEPVVALGCQHAYHSECISKWLEINKVCPICNIEVSSSK